MERYHSLFKDEVADSSTTGPFTVYSLATKIKHGGWLCCGAYSNIILLFQIIIILQLVAGRSYRKSIKCSWCMYINLCTCNMFNVFVNWQWKWNRATFNIKDTQLFILHFCDFPALQLYPLNIFILNFECRDMCRNFCWGDTIILSFKYTYNVELRNEWWRMWLDNVRLKRMPK